MQNSELLMFPTLYQMLGVYIAKIEVVPMRQYKKIAMDKYINTWVLKSASDVFQIPFIFCTIIKCNLNMFTNKQELIGNPFTF